MENEFIRRRAPLPHYAEAIRRGKITVGFVGGSITEPENGKRWSDKVADWLVATHPGLDVTVENAAKGATGSLSAVFRVDRDILPCPCDIVFVETSVNDSSSAFGACREGLLRKLLGRGTFDVVLVYTYCEGFLAPLIEGGLPKTILDWEELAGHYGVTSVLSGPYAFSLFQKGFVRYEEWLPGGLHPEFAGSRLYAEPVTELLKEAEGQSAAPRAAALPQPLHADHWEKAAILPWEAVKRTGPWRLVRERRLPTVDYILYTAGLGASLSFEFEGRGVELRRNINKLASEYKYRFDGGDWIAYEMNMPDWGARATDWVNEELLLPPLAPGKHTFELQTKFSKGNTGTNFELCTIGIIP